ncbi:MAG: acetyl-CoA decarbonylase/synthase complex subunit gamma [Dethiobacter sp.]|nr:acetyl-CoA decarbonylase/synthase complex subunit gamma [Dethiobacter sp.]
MGLTGLEIYKLLPKTNTSDCGFPTCLAFAMALAAGKTVQEKCPHLSAEGREVLAAAAAPPMRLVRIGSEGTSVAIGNETELFRHDKRFHNPGAIAVEVTDTEDLHAFLADFSSLEIDRVGQHYVADLVALRHVSGDVGRFREAAEAIKVGTKRPVVLISDDVTAMSAAVVVLAAGRPLICAATPQNFEAMTELAKKYSCPLAVRGGSLADLSDLTEKIIKLGHRELVLDSGSRETATVLHDLTQLRRAAVRKRYLPFAYPAMAFTGKDDPLAEIVQASTYLSKYASLVVLKARRPEHLLPLMTWRANLYTDPQKPIQVESRLVAVGAAGPDSPVYITTNFSLTYFIVEGEVANSKIPAFILPVNTEGTSVLTAWAAGKLTGEAINKALEENDLASRLNHKTLVLPGYVAVLSGSTQEATGWKVMVGPREASGIPKFARENFAS